jgi:hypothetical protein
MGDLCLLRTLDHKEAIGFYNGMISGFATFGTPLKEEGDQGQ